MNPNCAECEFLEAMVRLAMGDERKLALDHLEDHWTKDHRYSLRMFWLVMPELTPEDARFTGLNQEERIKPKNTPIKKLVPLQKVNTPEGIGTLLGRQYDENPQPETDTAVIEGDSITVLVVQFFEQGQRGHVGFFPSNLVEAVE